MRESSPACLAQKPNKANPRANPNPAPGFFLSHPLCFAATLLPFSAFVIRSSHLATRSFSFLSRSLDFFLFPFLSLFLLSSSSFSCPHPSCSRSIPTTRASPGRVPPPSSPPPAPLLPRPAPSPRSAPVVRRPPSRRPPPASSSPSAPRARRQAPPPRLLPKPQLHLVSGRPGHGRARAGLPRPGALPLPPLRPLLPSIPPVPTPGAAPVRPRVTAAVALLLLASVLRPVAAGLPPPCLSCCCCSRLLFRCHVTVCPRCLRARACAAAAPGCPRASGAAPCLRLPFPRCPVRARCVVSPCRVPVSRREAPIPDVFPFPTLSRREPSSPFRRDN